MSDGYILVAFKNCHWGAVMVADYRVVQQLRKEAGLANMKMGEETYNDYDKLLTAAGNHGLGLAVYADSKFPEETK